MTAQEAHDMTKKVNDLRGYNLRMLEQELHHVFMKIKKNIDAGEFKVSISGISPGLLPAIINDLRSRGFFAECKDGDLRIKWDEPGSPIVPPSIQQVEEFNDFMEGKHKPQNNP